MRAHNVAAKAPESFDIAGQKCCECQKQIAAPWGRINHGKDWVCSSHCHELYKYKLQGIDNNIALVHQLTSGD